MSRVRGALVLAAVLLALLLALLTALLTALLIAPLTAMAPARPAHAQVAGAPPPGVQETELSITTSDGVVLPATLHAPAERRPGLPGMVLVHGSGPSVREQYRLEAEAFARAGIVTLTYDKRADGYSLLQRSYSRLADDAVAAAATLRQRPEVDPARVGLWGLSEGGWVAPLAASRAPETAFLVTVGANGVSPLRQQTWAEATRLEHAGARGSLVDAASRTLYRLIAGMGLFPEPYYDPGPPLRTLTLPVLGIWGAQDRLTPPVESVAAFRAALDEAGNRHYTLRTLPGGEHRARATTTGFDRSDRFAPGYLELVAAWVGDVAAGRAPARAVAGAGEQPRPTVDVPPLAWYESVWAQWAAPVVLLAGFAGLGAGAAWRRLRGRRGPAAPWSARVLAAAGLAVVLGWPAYLAHLQAAGGRTIDLGPLLAGRPLPWLALQALAVVAVVALAVLGARQVRGDGDRARSAVLLGTGAVFVPWALYWGLLLP